MTETQTTVRWQPISSAPRDGTEILAWLVFSNDQSPDGAAVIEWREIPPNYEGWMLDGWCRLAPTGDPDDDREPTHWLPLPEPPSAD